VQDNEYGEVSAAVVECVGAGAGLRFLRHVCSGGTEVLKTLKRRSAVSILIYWLSWSWLYSELADNLSDV
jgi:hypothetical protein